MSDTRKLKDLSRQELYDLIWATPVAKVAADFGVTEATVKNHCANRQVPRPNRRYWKRLATGITPRKKGLPPTTMEIFEMESQRQLTQSLPLPEPGKPLQPLAAKLLAALKRTKLEKNKVLHLRNSGLPEVTVTKPQIERVAQAFHVILQKLEPLGIQFKKTQCSWNAGYFGRGSDRLFFHIFETLADRAGNERRVDSYDWSTGGTPTGRLAFHCHFRRWHNGGEMEWQETKQHKLGMVLSEMVAGICQHFLDKQRARFELAERERHNRQESERRHREWLAEEVIRKQKEAEQAHENAIKSAAGARKQDLIKAAAWWHHSCGIADFINECENRWKDPTGELNPEQAAWLGWAREIAAEKSPFTAGYPEPSKHGAIDASAIPFWGPYPAAHNFSPPEK